MTPSHLSDVVRESATTFGDRPALLAKHGGRWTGPTYAEAATDVSAVAQALVDLGIEPGQSVGIWSANRPEWLIADLGVLSARAVTVPVYATNTPAQAEYLVADAQMVALFVGDQAQYDAAAAFRERQRGLRTIIALDPDVQLRERDSWALRDLVAAGRAADSPAAAERRRAQATADDVATIIYTSGTTGQPKGAVLTHANFLSQLRALDERFSISPDDRSLSFLPLSHAYERGWSLYVYAHGAQNHLLADPRAVLEALDDVRPTLMVSVPRLFEKVYAGVQDRLEAQPPVKQRLARWALRVGGAYHHRLLDGANPGPLLRAQHAAADRLVLSSIRDVVGGPKHVLAAGGAPLSSDIEEFFLAAGLLVNQGYGMTETTAMLTCNYPGGTRFGTVGRPVWGVELRISDEGEVLARGAQVMRGYHGRPDETADAIQDGWLRTGDIGSIDDDGYLRITDRIKDIIITSQGKNVAPQHVEMQYAADHLVEQVVVVGDRRPYLAALVQPAFPALEDWARQEGLSWSTREELVALPDVVALYRQRIDDGSASLAGYERIKRFALVPREFSQADGELTPTLKIRRRVVAERYQPTIDAMYDGQ